MIEYKLNGQYPNPFNLEISNLDANLILDFSECGGELHIFFKAPSETEFNNMQYGDIRVALSYINGVIIFQIKFGFLPWLDVAYNAQISMLNGRLIDLKEIEAGKGYALSIILVDTNVKLVKALRLVALPHHFSQILRKAMIEQLEGTFFIKAAYENNVRTILENMSSKNLLKYALVNEKLR